MKPEDNPRLYESGCAGKERYVSEGAAVAAAEYGKRKKVTRGNRMNRGEWDRIDPYLCLFSEPDEPHWHLGH